MPTDQGLQRAARSRYPLLGLVLLTHTGLLTACNESQEPSQGESSTGESEAESTGAEQTGADASGESGAPSNAPPAAEADVLFAVQDLEASFDLAADLLANDADPDGDSVEVGSVDATSEFGGTLTLEAGTLRYVPEAFFWGQDRFSYTVTDPSGETGEASVTVWVEPRSVPLELISAEFGGFAIESEHDAERTGYAVAGVSDINGDGLDDVLVGSPTDDGDPFTSSSGSARLVYGKTDTEAVHPLLLGKGIGGVELGGIEQGDRFGISVAGVGDFDADGLPDAIVGAPGSSVSKGGADGKAFIILASGEVIQLDGEFQSNSAGGSVGPAGDFNGDGIDDALVMASRADQDLLTGRSYVVYGSEQPSSMSLAGATGAAGFAIDGTLQFSFSTGRFGGTVGDVNGDGMDDLGFGAPGYVRIMLGRESASNGTLNELTEGDNGFQITGPDDFIPGAAVYHVAAAGDVNGDGLDDIVISIPDAAKDSGFVCVVFGTNDPTNIDTADLRTNGLGFLVDGPGGIANATDVSGAGDVNGDGFDDIIIGSPHAAINDEGLGRVFVVYGKDNTDPVVVADLASTGEGFELYGTSAGDLAGFSVSGAGDVNDDGLADLLVGSPGYNGSRGVAHVVFGAVTPATVSPPK